MPPQRLSQAVRHTVTVADHKVAWLHPNFSDPDRLAQPGSRFKTLDRAVQADSVGKHQKRHFAQPGNIAHPAIDNQAAKPLLNCGSVQDIAPLAPFGAAAGAHHQHIAGCGGIWAAGLEGAEQLPGNAGGAGQAAPAARTNRVARSCERRRAGSHRRSIPPPRGQKENAESGEQSHATGTAGTSATLLSPDPLGSGVSISSSEREAALQDAWRH